MRRCSVTKKLRVETGGLDDYRKLARLHYRDSRLTAYVAIFAMRFGGQTIGVIVYRMPTPRAELRNLATGNLFTGLDRATQIALVNKNIRCISRVIVEPRFRGLGLASRLVRETMPRMNVPIVEAMAVMGWVNPFFERAAMAGYAAKMPLRSVRLIEALSLVGIERQDLVNVPKVQQKLDQLRRAEFEFLEPVVRRFLDAYGEKRYMPPGLERTTFVLSRLTERPVYYIWFNPKLKLVTG